MKNLMLVIEKWLLILLTVQICSLFPGVTGLSEVNGLDTGWTSTVNHSVGIIFSLFVVTVAVFLVFMCGGCTDMEVGTSTHPVCGPSMSSDFHSGVNTTVMSASHVSAERIPVGGSNQTGLLYSLNPADQVTSDRFPRTSNEPTAPFFNGYGTENTQQGVPHRTSSTPLPHSPVSGYTATALSPGPHAHQPVPGTDSEPPPPTYDESMRYQQQQSGYR